MCKYIIILNKNIFTDNKINLNIMNESEFTEVNEHFFEKLQDETAVRTSVWGPAAWFFLHNMAMAYPKLINENNPEHIRKKDSMFSFLSNLGNCLPCPVCSVSYNQYIKEPLYNINKYLDSRAKLARFIYLIHERVNEKLGVAQCYRPSFKQVVKKHGKFLVGPDQCKVTDLEQQIKNSLKGCGDSNGDSNGDNKHKKHNMDFKKYKSIVTVIDKDTKKVEDFDIKEEIEQFGNINIGNGMSGTSGGFSNICSVSLIIILSIAVTVLLYLRFINK